MTVLNFGESRKYTGIHIKKFNIKTFSIQNSPKFNPTTYCQCRSKVYKHFFFFSHPQTAQIKSCQYKYSISV